MPPGGIYIALLSRVMDKSQRYAFACIRECLNRVSLDSCHTICFHSDCGPHFRGHTLFGSLTVHTLGVAKKHLRIQFGAEHHMKSRVDGLFGRMGRAVQQGRQEAMLKTIGDVVQCCESFRLPPGPAASQEMYIDFVPLALAKLRLVRFKRTVMPIPIKSCYEYRIRHNDVRRTHLFGTGPRLHVLTAVTISCHMLRGCPAGAAMTYMPERDMDSHLGLPAPDEASDEEEEKSNQQIAHDTKDEQGWRTSYRQQRPEEIQYTDLQHRLRWKRNRMTIAVDRHGFAPRR